MLAVRPPLHQEFRARQALCSPGDGWRAYKPPPPPDLGPAFHFLSSLLDPDAYACVRSTLPVARPALDKRLHGALEKAIDMPFEILNQIVEEIIDGEQRDVALACRYLNTIATPHIYRKITLRSAHSIVLFNRTLEANPSIGAYVRELHFTVQRLPFQELNKLCTLLSMAGHAERIYSLTFVGMPASDLHQALPFLKSFSPKTFRWSTSPCWQMRPAPLFVDFLAGWTQLEQLTLQNFQFDETLLLCIERLRTVKRVNLGGSGAERIESHIISSLLTTAQSQRPSPFSLNVQDVSFPRRLAIEGDLRAQSCSLFELAWS